MGRGEKQPVSRLSIGLAAALRVRLARLGWDQQDLAAKAGMSASYLSVRLRAERTFTLTDVENIAQALDMQPEQLMAEAAAESKA